MNVGNDSPLLRAIEKTAFRVSLLMRSASHPERQAIGTWSVGETANHLAHCYSAFIGSFEGTMAVDPGEIDEHNAEVLAADPVRDLDVLADRVDAAAPKYLGVAATFDEDTMVEIFSGVVVPASGVNATVLGEALVHGHDIARAEGLPWPIEPAHALLTLAGLVPVMVHFVDQDAAAGLDATFEIRFWGGSTQYWHVADGELTVDDSAMAPVDCVISADPVTMMLMSYGRIGPFSPSAIGKVRVWGRRPWLALRLGGLFKT